MIYRIVKDTGRYTYQEVNPKYEIENIDRDVKTLIDSDRGLINYACIVSSENGESLTDKFKVVKLKDAYSYLKSLDNIYLNEELDKYC